MTTAEPAWFTFASPTGGRMIPSDPPRELSGFRFARVFDGVSPDYAPQITSERGFVTDDEERSRLRAYLTGAPTIGEPRRATNVLDASETFPNAYHTDGVWIWSDQVVFYLERLGVAPEPDFYRHIRERGYAVPPVSDVARAAALRALNEWAAIDRRQIDEFLAEQGGAGGRFPPDVAARLSEAGWSPGRDIGEEARRWQADCLDDLARDTELRQRWEQAWAGMPEHLRTPPIQLHEAARRVMAEFGGLVIPGRGRGQGVTPRRVGLFPLAIHENVPIAIESTIELAQGLGVPLWPVGRVGDEPYQDELAVDPGGRAFVVGPDARALAGATFDEALVNLITGAPLLAVTDDWMWWATG